MTNTEKAIKILRSGDLSYGAWQEIEKLVDSAKGQDRYQCKDIASAFIAEGGDAMNKAETLKSLDDSIAKIMKKK